MSEFRLGDIVVCVDATSPSLQVSMTPEEHRDARSVLKLWAIYKITEVFPVSNAVRINAYWPTGRTGGYQSSRFKHLPKADDTFINQMRSLKPAKEKTRVR